MQLFIFKEQSRENSGNMALYYLETKILLLSVCLIH